ncbi:chitin deacetylase [Coprinopsis sp. MPI-PUGE-AT-0042]|nr:chitin deacetylase [Coprinopsis sp. MPI-PUGE-AT-0042]
MLFSAFLASLPLLASALYVPDAHHGHDHVERVALPKRWYQEESHPVHELFRRGIDGVDYPEVGTPTWSAPFPRSSPDPQALPAAWKDALDAAVAAGKIPAIPQSSNQPQTNPVYPAGVNPMSPEVCSSTYKCRHPGVIWNVPEGVFGSSFDDGPYPSSGRLIEFLSDQNVSTTHFMIGVHILLNPNEFRAAFEADNEIAVHTWTHPYMTTLSNLDILGQLGWTMQLIHHSTGGRVPRYWRPPYGDSDTRVQAIAQEVFGLETVIWNLDTNDWELAAGIQTEQGMHRMMEQWLDGPKTDGIMWLQHEVTDLSVKIFMDVFPLIEQKGWRYESLARALGDGRVYQNAESSASDDVTPMDVGSPGSGGDSDDDNEDEDDDDSTTSASASGGSSGTNTRTGGL